jgi:DHA1 family tetracycline resistance protein-like MFS transporter
MPFLVAAGFSVAALLLVATRLPESRPPEGLAKARARVLSLQGLRDTFTLPGVGRLVAIGSLDILAFAVLEGTFSLYLRDQLGWTASGALAGFAALGFVSALVQGGLIRKLVPLLGETRLMLSGLASLAIGLAGLARTRESVGLMIALVIVGVGQGLASPSISGLLSRSTPPDEQGAVFGAFTSAQTVARMLNYLVANLFFGLWGPAAPFWEGAILALIAFVMAAWGARRPVIPAESQGVASAVEPPA